MKHPIELIELVSSDRLDPSSLKVDELRSIVDNLILRRQLHRDGVEETQRKLDMMDDRREYAKELRKDRRSSKHCLRELNGFLRYYKSLFDEKTRGTTA